MKEKISLRLKDLVGKNNLLNLSERTIARYAEVVSKKVTEETELTDDFYDEHLEILKTMNGQIYADLTDKVEEVKRNYKLESQNSQSASKTENSVDEPQWAKDLREKFSSIEGKLTAKEKAEILEGNMNKARSILKANGASNEKVLNIALKLTEFDEGMTPEQIAEKGKSVYDSTYKDLYGEGAAPGAGNSSSSAGSKAVLDQFEQKLRSEGKLKTENKNV